MNAADLKKQLDDRLDEFSHSVGDYYHRDSSEPATKGDINFLARRVFDLIDDSNRMILSFLENQ